MGSSCFVYHRSVVFAAALCRALVNSDLNGPLADFLFALLTALHNLQAQEDKAAEQFSSQESTKVS